MRYLLDVSALVALGLLDHAFHKRVTVWVASEPQSEFLTCAITELGFVRVLAQTPLYKSDVE